MAKSLRSKWKRKMKAIKRVRYAKKELEKLQMIVETAKKSDETGGNDIEMTQDLYTVVTRSSTRRSRADDKVDSGNTAALEDASGVERMDTDGKPRVARIFSSRTMRDQFGNFPEWMGSHKRKKLMIKTKKDKRKKNKKKGGKKSQK